MAAAVGGGSQKSLHMAGGKRGQAAEVREFELKCKHCLNYAINLKGFSVFLPLLNYNKDLSCK